MISNRRYWFLLALTALVYVAGMFVTLFENDSAQFATMALRMVRENDFLSLFKGPQEYLDKPHMHYWLAALSLKVFGAFDWAYRIPAMLITFLGAYSCYGLGKTLYNTDTGKLSALIFLTSQTIVLSVIDVRTDAVLTGLTIFSLWQLSIYIQKRTLQSILLGAIGAGLAFSTKGQIALVVIALPILCHIAYARMWKRFLSWKVLLAFAVFALTVAPMLYAYYHQFDLHPEKIIRGRSNRSGILFIFWEQSFERMTGTGMGKNSSDYFFFFHTFLWVFLPWTIIGIMAIGSRIKAFFKMRLAYRPKYELLTLGGALLIFVLISFAQFKLPHYLNITIPLFSVLSASYLHSLYKYQKAKTIKFVLGVQYFVLGVVFIATVLICFLVFKFEHLIASLALGASFIMIIYFCLKREAYYLRIITIAALSSLLLNVVLNMHFYPSLLKYQAGSEMAKTVDEEQIPVDRIYKLSEKHSWAMDFYNQEPVKISSLQDIKAKKNVWVYATTEELKQLSEEGMDWDRQFSKDHFRITRLQATFLNPATRNKVVEKMHLIHIY
ncbi:ArnT family glycosyltransferase [Maribacter sp. 2-571]|uniref:ArnT family glycosyltransferase n=1 Tax=Maribacter sp. 2-571 TaxID=3417569 RepID=UPI003D345962